MLVHKINPDNIHQYRHRLAGILRRPNLLGVFSEGCGHCHAMKPSWEQMKSRLNTRKCGSGIVELDSRVLPEVNNQMIKQKINGYPTIMIIKSGRPSTEYTGDRSAGDLTNFFNKHLKSKSSTKKLKSSLGKKSRKSRKIKKRNTVRKNKRKMRGGHHTMKVVGNVKI